LLSIYSQETMNGGRSGRHLPHHQVINQAVGVVTVANRPPAHSNHLYLMKMTFLTFTLRQLSANSRWPQFRGQWSRAALQGSETVADSIPALAPQHALAGSRRHTKWSVLRKGLSETMGSDDGAITKVRDPLVAVVRWVKARSPKEKTYLGAAAAFVVGWDTRSELI
jgi:hypothetical protein